LGLFEVDASLGVVLEAGALCGVKLEPHGIIVIPVCGAARQTAWKAPAAKYTSGVFQKYVKLVGSAARGAVTG
jgi:hypothetical protein